MEKIQMADTIDFKQEIIVEKINNMQRKNEKKWFFLNYFCELLLIRRI